MHWLGWTIGLAILAIYALALLRSRGEPPPDDPTGGDVSGWGTGP